MSQQPPPNDPGNNPYASPETVQAVQQPPGSGDSTGGVIPYKNPCALFAYYMGLFSLLPCIGIVLAVPAVVLGILGLRARSNNPAVKGSVHAWIGIVLGGLMTLLWGGMILVSILASAAG